MIHHKRRRNGSLFGPLSTVKKKYEKSSSGAIQLQHYPEDHHVNTPLLLLNTVLGMQLSTTDLCTHRPSTDARIESIIHHDVSYLETDSDMWHRKTQQRVISQSRAVTNLSVQSGFYSKPATIYVGENTNHSTGILNKKL
jgi:hypothetical protein